MRKLNKKIINIMLLSALAVLGAGCQKNPDSQTNPDSDLQTQQEVISDPGENPGAEPESGTDPGAESESPAPTNAPFPEADMNAVNFNDGNFSFVSVMQDDPDNSNGGLNQDLICAQGALSVELIDGNFMLKFTDESTDIKNIKNIENIGNFRQGLRIAVGQLLNPDQLESVRKIGFDLYAEAKGDLYQDESGESLRVPGAISGNGLTICADGTTYGFENFSAGDVNQYALERSDACHVEFEFPSDQPGKCWDSSIPEENLYFTIERLNMENMSDLYLDNLVFYDAEGNSIPLHIHSDGKQTS